MPHIGERDFPLRLQPPSRIIGRDDEIAALRGAFADALTGRCPGVLVSGPPGVGKTSLVDELRPIVTASGGWFVSGKFDQFRRDLEFDGVHQAFRALGRLLLAQPEEEVAETSTRILRALGHNAGLATAVTPELATLLAVPPDMGDPLTVEARAQRNSVEILRVVASRERPVVFFVDDLQWAGRTPLGFVDLVLSGQEERRRAAARGRVPGGRRRIRTIPLPPRSPAGSSGTRSGPSSYGWATCRHRVLRRWWPTCSRWTSTRSPSWPRRSHGA